jgi:hypothetical protein
MTGVIKMLSINEKIGGLNINIAFENGINCIDLGKSGSGKTFLMSVIESFCVKNSIGYKHFNYSSQYEDIYWGLSNINDKTKVVLLDNADRYMNEELSEIIKGYKDIVFIICIKRRLKINASYRLYSLVYNADSLVCEEV